MQYALFYIDFFVNNIQKNHHLTALNGDFIIVCVTFLIIPFNRFSPFLPKKVGIKQNGYYCVNALYRAFSISTVIITKWKDATEKCVNALYRAFSISTRVRKLQINSRMMCQCPLSGFFHFYNGGVSNGGKII